MANTKLNATWGLTVGQTPINAIDELNNATFLTLGVTGASTLGAVSATSLSVSGAASFNTIPTSVQPALNDNTTKLATTNWFFGQVGTASPLMDSVAAVGTSTLWSRQDHVHPTDTSRSPVASPIFTGTIGITGATITVDTPIINATQTWNSTATFSGIKLVVTDTGSQSNIASKLLDLQIGSNKFGVDKNGSIVQVLATPNIARDIVGVTGSRHIREYQDLNDYAPTQGIGGATTNTENIEWGFTWNAKWDVGTSLYVKDRSNANDHALMSRSDKKYRQQWWFSDGTTAASPIAWVKRIDFDFPNNTYTFAGALTATALTASSNGAITGGSLTLAGAISGATTIDASGVITSTLATGTAPFVVASTTRVINLTATNTQHLLGGNQWGFVYQSAVGVTAFTTAGAVGQVLKSAGTSAPVWVNGTISGVALGSNLFALTVNNSGAGVASGSTFNGSAAVTISYNSVGASPLAGSTSLTTLGTIATGTWNATTIAIAKGGTGLTATGTGNQLLGVVNAGGVLEYKTLTSSDSSLSFTHTANAIDIKLVGTLPGNINFSGDLSVGGSSPTHKFLVSAASGNTDIKGTLNIVGKTTSAEVSSTMSTLNDGTADSASAWITTTTVPSAGTTPIASVPNTFRSAEFTIQVSVAGSASWEILKMLAVHNGSSTTSSVEYGEASIGSCGCTYTLTAVGGVMTLNGTSSLPNTVYKVVVNAIK